MDTVRPLTTETDKSFSIKEFGDFFKDLEIMSMTPSASKQLADRLAIINTRTRGKLTGEPSDQL